MKIHHLDCGSLCPRGGRLFGGKGGPWAVAPMCCHCLLIEGEDGLVLVDSGLGVEDVADPGRLGFLFNAVTRPRLEIAETARRQIAGLGFHVDDVRHIVPTHLDLDHAGGNRPARPTRSIPSWPSRTPAARSRPRPGPGLRAARLRV